MDAYNPVIKRKAIAALLCISAATTALEDSTAICLHCVITLMTSQNPQFQHFY
jgi:hypothetical protein